jgi:tyrosinase
MDMRTRMELEKSEHIEIRRQIEVIRHEFFRWHLPKQVWPKTVTRKNQAKLTPHEQESFICAYSTFISLGIFGPLVAIHGDMSHRMHGFMGPIGAERFLPWHRVYLYVLEQHIQAYHPGLGIPYWDWTVDKSVPPWLQNYLPTVVVTGNPVQVVRQPGAANALPTPANVAGALGSPTFDSFENALETIHNGVHVWVGGTMAVVPTAPADPMFWLHHCNSDRVWAKWEVNDPNLNPSLAGADAVMDPWTTTEPQTRTTTALAYKYDALP